MGKRKEPLITREELQKLIDKGITDRKIGEKYGVSAQVAYYWRVKVYKIARKSLRETDGFLFTHDRLELLFGCLLGDGHMRKNAYDTGPYFSCTHSLKQKEYLLYKASFFVNECRTVEHYRKIPNKITGKLYSDITMYLKVNRFLNFLYDAFYQNGKKRIPLELLNEFYTPLAMAIHFMDDGSRVGNTSYIFSTCCFNKEEINKLCNFLLEKYDLKTALTHNNRLYIKHESNEKFKSIIYPYICNSMQYKLIVS